MKNTFKLLGAIVLSALIGLAVTSCSTTDLKSNAVGEYNVAPVAAKDYELLGFVSVNATETYTVGFLGFTSSHTGERVTFDMLLQQARRDYPQVDEIINVRIDRIDKGTRGPLDRIIGYTDTIQWIGNAVAIKYTDVQPGTGPNNGVGLQTSGLNESPVGGFF